MSDNRRDFIKKSAILAAASAVSSSALGNLLPDDGNLEELYDYSIENGDVYFEGKLQKLYVGINSSGRLKISQKPLKAQQYINAAGKIVSPGFIDILADNSSAPEDTYLTFESYKVSDGVTSALQLHGGHHKAATYYKTFTKKSHYINWGVSTKVMNIRRNQKSINTRLKVIEKNLAYGAIAISHSIEYQPTPYSELLEYGKLAYKYQRPLFLHLRYSSKEQELSGVIEAIKIARDTGAAVHIDHLNSTGGTFHMEKAISLIKTAVEEGLKITTCVYPYSYWATYLHSKRFDEGWRKRYNLTYSDLTVVGTGEKLSQSRFNELRSKSGVLVAVPEGTMPLSQTVDIAIKEDFCLIGSDGGIERANRANNHPRGAGCFATAVRHFQDIGIPLETILYKLTEAPTKLLKPALMKRGKLKDNYRADIIIFDKDTINGAATMANPNQFSDGIDYVFVNGEIACKQKKLKFMNGKQIKIQAAKIM
ncbi:amidohydrolase family protein [Paracrocinitomix mangrovi]|uniref:amidohydrolase family protein n=1 Tax=Paracrocinitomix mangrovi TaxID=2862509 RepID=UPI001C8EE009|nr:amidohydrolase family protein [Paracrocinitomix mangrovi]UKN03656.1 amidohydrolase family protein [Paracrocinitomix mangrovi]